MLVRVGAYQRDLPVSEARVWENVRDWEHLPYLHDSSFSAIELREGGRWGWHASVWLAGMARTDEPLDIELRIDGDGPTYHTRTFGAEGVQADIATTVTPLGPSRTRVEVSFDVADVPAEAADGVGAGYVELYTRLWDEDEMMMLGRQTALDGRAVGPERVVEVGGETYRFRPQCPHWGGPLSGTLEGGVVTCPWHGYRFDVCTGRSCDGNGLLLVDWKRG